MASETLQITAYGTVSQTIGVDFKARFKVENLRRTPTAADTKIWVVAGRCFKSSFCDLGTIAVGASKEVLVPHNWYGGVTFDSLDATIVYVINEGGKEVARQSFCWQMHTYTGGFKLYRPPSKSEAKTINILLFGLAGCGKSSYLQSVITALSTKQHVITGITPIGGGSEHVTTTLRKFAICEDVKVNLMDTWGLTPSNYVKGELQKIVQGILPDKWDMLDNMSENQDKIKHNMKKAKANAVHALMVFLPCSSLRNPKTIALLQPLLTDVKASGLNPIFLLALADEEVAATDKARFRQNPNATFPEIEAAMTNAAKVFNIPRNRIAISVPYTEEKERVFDIDRLLCKTLDLALQSADAYLAYRDFSDDEEEVVPAYRDAASVNVRASSESPPVTLQYLIDQFKAGYLDAEEFKLAKTKLLK